MKALVGIVSSTAIFLAGCDSVYRPKHDCSAESTKALLSKILSDELTEKIRRKSASGGSKIDVPNLNVEYNLLRPSSFDESIQKYECLGDVVVNVPQSVTAPFVGSKATLQSVLLMQGAGLKIADGVVSAPLKYSSQLLTGC